ncbi:MAG: LysM peptidoglycan-binding domain-containing protein [Desulfobacteraceae bacterium]|nr:LysM peptidoglycan-binding domain-containing protein [Desulfobacteraceae bacterium]
MFKYCRFPHIIIILNSFFLMLVLIAAPAAFAGFSQPDCLKDKIAFWKKIYTQVAVQEGLIHDRSYPLVIYKKITIGNLTGKRLKKLIKNEKNKITSALERINTLPESEWTGEEKRICKLFLKHAPEPALKKAAKQIRFQGGLKEKFKKGIERSAKYESFIRNILKKYNVPLQLAYLPHVESSFNPNARSKAGAAGLWQFMRPTGKQYLRITSYIDERYDPVLSTIGAAKHLKGNYGRLRSWPLAITAYNTGSNNVKRAVSKTGSRSICKITRNYSGRSFRFASKNFYASFLAACEVAENKSEYFKKIKLKHQFKRNSLILGKHISPNVICKKLKISLKTFKTYNPAIRSALYKLNLPIPPRQTVFFPATVSSVWAKNVLKTVPSEKRRYVQTVHKVRKGDCLSKIAKKIGIAAKKIARANGLSLKSRIYPGQVLKIPVNRKNLKKKVKRRKKSKSYSAYKVKKGDYLGRIAKKTGVSAKRIARVNNMNRRSTIYPGQILKIPRKK